MRKNRTQPIQVSIRFYGDLKEIIPGSRKPSTIDRIIPEPTSAKDLIEACGVPHTEIDLILADRQPVDFTYLIKKNLRISVYPVFCELEIPDTLRLQKRSLLSPHFLVDVNLGKLARYLRMAGFDTAYSNEARDEELINQMQDEKRVLLTRDRKLLMHNVVKTGYWPRSDHPDIQFEEVLRRFDLFNKIKPYSRCINCNGDLQIVQKDEILDKLKPLTKKHYEHFSQCNDCSQVYWAGSHRFRLPGSLKKLLKIQPGRE